MFDFHTKLHEGGRLVIPAACRKELGLETGTDIVLRLEKDGLRLYPAKRSLTRLRQLARKHLGGRRLVEELLADRRKEAADE